MKIVIACADVNSGHHKFTFPKFFETIKVIFSVFVGIPLNTPSLSFDISVNQEYIRLEDWIRRGIIIAKLDNIANPALSRGGS